MYKCSIILAAGEGKRMKSNTPKVLHKVCGKEMLNHVIDTVKKSGLEDINLVIGNKAEKVKESTIEKGVTFSFQENQLGTGHAVMCAKEFLNNKDGIVTIFTGDAPLITEDTVRKLVKFHEDNKYDATVLTSVVDNPDGYGRIIRNDSKEVRKIIEHKDCDGPELNVKEINSGMYCFNIKSLLNSLDKLSNNNAQEEYYLTDVIEILKKEGLKVGAVSVPFEEIIGVNSRVELAKAEKIMKRRINLFHMENGVTLIDPDTTYIGSDVIIGKDTIIYPGNVLEGNTEIKDGCILYSNSRIIDSIIEEGVTIESSLINKSHIGRETTVGPYANIRPESIIGKNVKIGDFVEIKKSSVGDNTKISHLTYIGDAEIGTGCNLGCGIVVVNYDGKSKNKTIIGNNSFIGCNTNLVSPVEIKDNTYIAAGSTITKEVPEGALAIARAKQVNLEGWVDRKGLRK